MKKEYLRFSTEELIDERPFVSWALNGENDAEWQLFLTEHPEFRPVTQKARRLIELLRDREDHISKEDMLEIWRNIENFDVQIKNRSRRIKLPGYLRYAAILILALLTGTMGYRILDRRQNSYVFSTNYASETDSASILFLSDGTMVDLETKNSKIALNAGKQIVINNGKVIDLAEKSASSDLKMNEVVIPYGKKSQLVLEDGTKVWLNAGSKMAFPTKFSDKKREIFLEGEAYLEVAHNENRPFWVNTKEISVKVLGTKFNISAYPTDHLAETVLIEGKVSVSERGPAIFHQEETILYPNQRASYHKTNKTISVRNEPDVEFITAWTEGWFKFSKQSMNDVLNKLQRYYNIQFVYDSGLTTSDLISGKLDLKDSIEQVMIALSDVANIKFRICNEKIFIENKLNQIKMRK